MSAAQRDDRVKTIRAKATFAGTFRFLSPWPRVDAKVNGKTVKLQSVGNGVFSCHLDRGDVAELTPIEACVADERLGDAGVGIGPRSRTNLVRSANTSCAGINKGPSRVQ